MDEGKHPLFPKMGDLGLAKNYRGITLTFLGKTKMASEEIDLWGLKIFMKVSG